jgi:antitoxin VapB
MRNLLDQHQVDGLLLRRVSSFAWATCGAASYVNTATTEGAASLLVTRDDCFLITNNIEAPRLEEEEHLVEQGWTLCVAHWASPMTELNRLTTGLRLIADVPFQGAKEIGAEIARQRTHLTAEEGDRFRQLGNLCAKAMNSAARAVRPGMTEMEMAALLGSETQQRGVQPVVNLMATDERIYRYRHPLPTNKKLQKYAMLVLSGRKFGLVCSISRLVHFGPVPIEIQERVRATAQVNATLVAHSRPGAELRDIFRQGQAVYTAEGFPNEWEHHHQGGVIGYEPREYLGMPDTQDVVAAGQALAWNPTIAGAKVEDTILIGKDDNEIITAIPGWPVLAVTVPDINVEVKCPMVLEMD